MKDVQALLTKEKGTSQLNIFDKLKEDALILSKELQVSILMICLIKAIQMIQIFY